MKLDRGAHNGVGSTKNKLLQEEIHKWVQRRAATQRDQGKDLTRKDRRSADEREEGKRLCMQRVIEDMGS